jgi:hypothetical protein
MLIAGSDMLMFVVFLSVFDSSVTTCLISFHLCGDIGVCVAAPIEDLGAFASMLIAKLLVPVDLFCCCPFQVVVF